MSVALMILKIKKQIFLSKQNQLLFYQLNSCDYKNKRLIEKQINKQVNIKRKEMSVIDSERDLLEVRAELKKFKRIEPKRILSILKSIKECESINKEWIRKTRITKTLVRISQFKYPNQDEPRILVGKLARNLLIKFRAFFPKLKSISQDQNAAASAPTAASTNAENSSVSNAQPQQQKAVKANVPVQQKTQSTEQAKPDTTAQNNNLPAYKNDRRNQGLQGILKYFQKGFEESKMNETTKICVEIEKFFYSRNTTGDSFNENSYKEDVKKLCKQFIDKENSQKFKNSIYDEFQIKKVGSLDCIIEILK
ncbi:hypothetical protein TTHERM_000899549 (macronuclear) [Tetrahymena thermophila SB210]|uniref:Uncharacterized protein n=1 Tax=Tetrahymena thermophila (strain SB210) TaxID=312017 RepID=W7X6G4_TETTS|nr:hypothetical protein TTHERM_000899549 [Tetrahymena thermophila SB210]EWS73002.1 hypothetical protein TTHERM_000899549 [Tetrahymena thermophila SB210]|eukprot:XP_012654470.1 hypothetical protein TTHERM_000899549 [Tetrahymena thermophila SB210]